MPKSIHKTPEGKFFHLGCSDCDVLSDVADLEGRPESVGEEIANSVSHGLGFLAVLIGAPFLIARAAHSGMIADIVGASIFLATLLALYSTSTLYHALPRGHAKHILRRVEHALIYLLIAGTYTPFTLGVMRGPWGWTLFGIIWGLALAGVALKSLAGTQYPTLSMLLYLSMGWVVVIALPQLWIKMPHAGLLWLIVGGLAYTIGTFFYAGRRRYSHFVWHLFVLAGSSFHYFTVLWYAD